MFRSAVFKLTAAFTAIVMSICVVFSILLYRMAIHELQTGFNNQYTRWYDAYEPFGLRNPGNPAAELALRADHILTQIIYFNILVLIVTAVACYLLARRTLRPIEAAHEQQKRFTADVSHELRTPLTSIKMESEVGLIDPKSPVKELRRVLGSNLEEVERMETLVNNLLLISSMEAGKVREDFTKLDIQTIVETAVHNVDKHAKSKDITINTRLNNCSVRGDQASLTQLFIILIENGIKYSPEGSTITISIFKGKGRVIASIQDKGAGIPSAALPHVFDRFYRADSARSKSASLGSNQGFGLGLSLAKLIADLHGGEIILTSTQGSGTNAAVILPTSLRN